MKKATTTLLLKVLSIGNVFSNEKGDTVVIELDNKSKIVIYTENKAELKDLEDFDINKMIRDLNRSIEYNDGNYIELTDNGDKYRKNTSLTHREEDLTARVRIGKVELEADELDRRDLGDRFEDKDRGNYRQYSYIDQKFDRTDNNFNIDLGTGNWLGRNYQFPQDNDELYSVRPWGSWYVGLNSINKTWIGGPVFLEWGLGLSWYNWKWENPDNHIVKNAEGVLWEPVSTDINPQDGKLSATYINFQMLPMFDFAQGRKKVKTYDNGGVRLKRYRRDGIRIGGGGYVGYRVGSRSKLVYTENGSKEKDIDRDTFFLNNIRYGIRAQLGWKDVDFFASYDLNEVFVNNKGPKLNAITFGIIL